MKKILNIVICALFAFSVFSPITYVHATDEVFIEERIVDGIEGFYYTVPNDKNEYFVTNDGNKVTIYNLTNNEIIGTAFIESHLYSVSFIDEELNRGNEQLMPYALVDDYDKWSAFTLIGTNSMEISDIESASLSTIIGYVTGLFNPLGGAISGWITSIAVSVYNNKYGHLKAEVYQSVNRYCTILVKKYSKIYDQNKLFQTTPIQAVWNSSPWDYVTAPQPCRVLTERY